MNKILAAAILTAATAAHAEERPQFNEFLASLDGTEVSARVDIGYRYGSELFLHLDGIHSGIAADAAIDREQLASIEGCSASGDGARCTADILAELNFSDGRIFATVFDVQNVTRGE